MSICSSGHCIHYFQIETQVLANQRVFYGTQQKSIENNFWILKRVKFYPTAGSTIQFEPIEIAAVQMYTCTLEMEHRNKLRRVCHTCGACDTCNESLLSSTQQFFTLPMPQPIRLHHNVPCTQSFNQYRAPRLQTCDWCTHIAYILTIINCMPILQPNTKNRWVCL